MNNSKIDPPANIAPVWCKGLTKCHNYCKTHNVINDTKTYYATPSLSPLVLIFASSFFRLKANRRR